MVLVLWLYSVLSTKSGQKHLYMHWTHAETVILWSTKESSTVYLHKLVGMYTLFFFILLIIYTFIARLL
jgi:hypothetical protein